MHGEELRARRARLKLSQDELARKLEVTRQSIYAWERGITGAPGMLDLALRWLEHETGIAAPAPDMDTPCPAELLQRSETRPGA